MNNSTIASACLATLALAASVAYIRLVDTKIPQNMRGQWNVVAYEPGAHRSFLLDMPVGTTIFVEKNGVFRRRFDSAIGYLSVRDQRQSTYVISGGDPPVAFLARLETDRMLLVVEAAGLAKVVLQRSSRQMLGDCCAEMTGSDRD